MHDQHKVRRLPWAMCDDPEPFTFRSEHHLSISGSSHNGKRFIYSKACQTCLNTNGSFQELRAFAFVSGALQINT
jgi:hypothetical protein